MQKLVSPMVMACLLLSILCVTSCVKPPLHLRGLREIIVDIDANTDVDRMWQRNWRQEWTAVWDTTAWGELGYHYPKSVRMHTYTRDAKDSIKAYDVLNFNTMGGTISTMDGVHDMLFHNNDTEYIRYSTTDTSTPLYATTRIVSKGLRSSQFLLTTSQKAALPTKDGDQTKLDENDTLFIDVPVAYQPDQLFSVLKDRVVIPDNEVYVDDYLYVQTIKGTMDPISYIYLIQVDLKNNNGRVVGSDGGAAVTGQAAGVWVASKESSRDSVSVLFDMYMVKAQKRMEMAKSRGEFSETDSLDCLAGRVMTFGMCARNPYLETRAVVEHRNYLVLNITYHTAEQRNIRVDITDKMRALPLGGVIRLELDVNDFPPGGTGNTFDAIIDGWSEHEGAFEIK